jgi:WhiB family redox-sensing transcriptional regulator
MQWRDATVGQAEAKDKAKAATRATGPGFALPVGLDLPCVQDPEAFFAESPQGVEQAKAMCRSCRARVACLAGALERSEPWGIWGGELLMSGAIVPRKRRPGRPRKTEVAAA